MVQTITHMSKEDQMAHNLNKAILFRQINTPGEFADQSVFKKDAKQKEELWAAKKKWKEAMKLRFPNPIERKRQNNPIPWN